MKRLEIIVEGVTESDFVTQVLAPYLESLGLIEAYCVCPIIIRTHPNHRGGMSKYTHLRSDILSCLSSCDKDLTVSMMIDFFALPSNVPRPQNYNSLKTDYDKVKAIEQCIFDDIDDYRFIPYIQLHEFEALLFASKVGFDYCYENDPRALLLKKIVDSYDNPEEINTSPSGAPSKRILAIIPEYQKGYDGNVIMIENGIDVVIAKCPGFRKWIKAIIEHLSQMNCE